MEAWARGQVVARTSNYGRRPPADIGGILEQEFAKGEACAIELFSKIPAIRIEQIRAELNLPVESEDE